MLYLVVFDTSILMSAIGWHGKPFQCLDLARKGARQGVTCWEILDELADKLPVKLNFSAQQVIDTITDLLTFLRVVTITNTLKVVTADPDDDKIVECAVVGSATYIVTGDHHLLALGSYQGIQIVRAADFLALMPTP